MLQSSEFSSTWMVVLKVAVVMNSILTLKQYIDRWVVLPDYRN